MSFVTRQIGPVRLVATTADDAVDEVFKLVDTHGGVHVHLANAYTLALADKDHSYKSVLSGDAVNFPDGRPLSVVSRARGDKPPLRQVRGPQLFLDVLDRGRSRGMKHFLLGSTDEVLELIRTNVEVRYPGTQIVGAESPPFRAMTANELAEQDSRIADSDADIVWVGLGTPKQDIEVKRLAGSLPVVAVAVGAAFDFTAGTLKPAPKWVRQIGIEWSHRLVLEPRRLWKRYLFGNTRFLLAAARTWRVRS
jgi:N-acetylglucosaminyldiphosphoundecaprenol N-acetyl-beta-D-mannosaminyltransferase